MQHDAKGRRGERNRDQDERRPHQVEQSSRERDRAEHLVLEQDDRQPKRRAQPRVKPGLAGERNRAVLDREIAQIERLAEAKEADDKQPVGLARRRQEERTSCDRHGRSLRRALINATGSDVRFRRMTRYRSPE